MKREWFLYIPIIGLIMILLTYGSMHIVEFEKGRTNVIDTKVGLFDSLIDSSVVGTNYMNRQIMSFAVENSYVIKEYKEDSVSITVIFKVKK